MKQSVAEHSYNTAMMCVRIGEALHSAKIPVDRLRLVYRALYHDIPETESNDIPYPFKQALKSLLEQAGTHMEYVEQTALESDESNNIAFFEIEAMWGSITGERELTVKSDIVERILSFADMLELVHTISMEILTGNESVNGVGARALEIAFNRFSTLFTELERSIIAKVPEVANLLELIQSRRDAANE